MQDTERTLPAARRWRPTLALVAVVLGLIVGLASCSLYHAIVPAPTWVELRGVKSVASPVAPVKRVLVLPFTAGDALPAHARSLCIAVAQSLRDACGFDVVAPDDAELPRTTRDELRAGGGRDVPALIRLHREWGADAVLYGQLAFSRPHGEPAVGLKLELIDARDGAKLWLAQDVVDARDPDVRAALLAFRRTEADAASAPSSADPGDATQVPLDSFARFVAQSFVRTLYAQPAPPPAPAVTARR